eukprot:scaffold56904_cov17-Tisochrysis_lutea.AAC.4
MSHHSTWAKVFPSSMCRTSQSQHNPPSGWIMDERAQNCRAHAVLLTRRTHQHQVLAQLRLEEGWQVLPPQPLRLQQPAAVQLARLPAAPLKVVLQYQILSPHQDRLMGATDMAGPSSRAPLFGPRVLEMRNPGCDLGLARRRGCCHAAGQPKSRGEAAAGQMRTPLPRPSAHAWHAE